MINFNSITQLKKYTNNQQVKIIIKTNESKISNIFSSNKKINTFFGFIDNSFKTCPASRLGYTINGKKEKLIDSCIKILKEKDFIPEKELLFLKEQKNCFEQKFLLLKKYFQDDLAKSYIKDMLLDLNIERQIEVLKRTSEKLKTKIDDKKININAFFDNLRKGLTEKTKAIAIIDFFGDNSFHGEIVEAIIKKLAPNTKITKIKLHEDMKKALEEINTQIAKGKKYNGINMSIAVDIPYDYFKEIGININPDNIIHNKTKAFDLLCKAYNETDPEMINQLKKLSNISSEMVTIAASGNDANKTFNFYSLFPNFKSVGALNIDGSQANYTNTALTDEYTRGSVFVKVSKMFYFFKNKVNLSFCGKKGYNQYNGTSFSTPVALAKRLWRKFNVENI